jgi:3-hydroxyacyl-[acyl-carrier-protein] dehydratase
MDIREILKLLPHRYPFLLVDRVLTFKKDDTITAIKNVTVNEPFFQGHFPEHPVMPGVMIIEAMAQASAILLLRSLDEVPKDSIFYFVGIDKARFKRPVGPGDQLTLKATHTRTLRGIRQLDCSAHVGDDLCSSAELMCTYKAI